VKKARENDDRPPSGDRVRLTLKQRKFGLAFVGEANGNGVEATRLAGYKGSDLTLAVVAHENLRKPNIQRFIEQLRSKAEAQAADHILSATEVLSGLTRFAKADVADLFPENEWMQEAKQRGVSRLIKSINFDKDTGKLTKLELHNAHGAHVDLGKYHKLFTDRLEIVKPTEAAREAFQAILAETGIDEDRARQIVAARFGISETDLISSEVM
jgi:hypothetical protein